MMNLYGLKYFFDSCRLGSMTAAAEINHVSRPAVSQAIKRLEIELGVSLLTHKRREFEPTSQGLLLAQKAEQIFSEIEITESLLRQSAPFITGTLKIGAAQALASFLLQNVIAKLKTAHKELELNIEIRSSQALVEKLIRNEIDIAFFLGDETLPGHKQVVVKSGFFKLIKPKRLSGKKALYAISEERPETKRVQVLFERKFDKKMPLFAQIGSWDAIWKWINDGLCGGLVPDFLLQRNPKEEKRIEVMLDKVWPYELKVLVPRSKLEDPSIAAFLESLEEVI